MKNVLAVFRLAVTSRNIENISKPNIIGIGSIYPSYLERRKVKITISKYQLTVVVVVNVITKLVIPIYIFIRIKLCFHICIFTYQTLSSYICIFTFVK